MLLRSLRTAAVSTRRSNVPAIRRRLAGALEALRPMGHHTQVGVCGQSIDFPMDVLFYKQLTVAGSVCYTEGTWKKTMQILADGRIGLGDLI
jgi:L-iditol 2-dehydrogenase